MRAGMLVHGIGAMPGGDHNSSRSRQTLALNVISEGAIDDSIYDVRDRARRIGRLRSLFHDTRAGGCVGMLIREVPGGLRQGRRSAMQPVLHEEVAGKAGLEGLPCILIGFVAPSATTYSRFVLNS